MTQKQLVDGIFAAISRIIGKKIVPKNIRTDSYSSQNSTSVYMSFELKGRKRWRFGLWTYQRDGLFSVNMFGQYSWFIDKFKPSYSPFEFSFDISENTEEFPMPYVKGHEAECPTAVFEFANAVRAICNSSFGALVKYYWNEVDGGGYHQAPVLWFINCFRFYSMRLPLEELWMRKLQILPLMIVRGLYKLRYGKKISTHIHPTPDFFSPVAEFYVIYNIEDEDSDEFFDTYVDINVKGTNDEGTIVYRKKFIPDWLFKRVDLENVTRADWNAGKRRGFYIPIKLKDSEEE